MIRYLLSTKGRLGRMSCFLIALALASFRLPIAHLVEIFDKSLETTNLRENSTIFIVLFVVLTLLSIAIHFAILFTHVKRLHDLNMSGWNVIWGMFASDIYSNPYPILNACNVYDTSVFFYTKITSGIFAAIYIILLFIVPGSKNENRFGPADTPSTSE